MRVSPIIEARMARCQIEKKSFCLKILPTLIIIAGMALPKPALAMEFFEATTGGNIDGSYWISAEGTIEKGDAEKFRLFVEKIGSCEEVVLNSPGGLLNEGLQLGMAFNELCKSTSVGKTERLRIFSKGGNRIVYEATKNDGVFDPQKGMCASACVYAFMGAKTRHVLRGNSALYVHQFYSNSGLLSPNEKKFDFQDLSSTQITMGILVSYLTFVDVAPRLAAIAANVPATTVYELTEQDVRELGIRRSAKSFAEPKVEASDNGFSVSVGNQNGSSLFIGCTNQRGVIRLRYAKIIEAVNGEKRAWINDVFSSAYGFSFGGVSIDKKNISWQYNRGKLEVMIDISNKSNFDNYSSLSLEAGLPMTAVKTFGFWIPYSKSPQILKSMAKSCS